MTRPSACPVCGSPAVEERYLLRRGVRDECYCSEACLVVSVQKRRLVWMALERRWLRRISIVALVVLGTGTTWRRFHAPKPRIISYEPPVIRPAPTPRPQPVFYGPAWPPTDEDWLYAFRNSPWTYPLPGPARRRPIVDDRVLEGRESTAHRPPACREAGRCGVDLGGELWGEHVYAVHDGIVDHVQHAAGDERGGVYLRLVHFGGMAFTHYFHLAAVPRSVSRGAHVRAGDLVGLVGDTGNEHPGRYMHFALSVRPSADLPEVYWDPTPLMTRWQLRVPPRGTVAGFVPRETDLDVPALHNRVR